MIGTVRLQILSDLHLETEAFDPEPAPGADLLVLAGDIDSSWAGLRRFRGWPVPVLMVAGNHEFDGRELRSAWPALREACAEAGIRLLQREALVWSHEGATVRFVGATRWSDFDAFGERMRAKAMRAAAHHLRRAAARIDSAPFDAARVREEGLACRASLERLLGQASGVGVDATVVVTHFAPTLRSADPRYGHQPGTASFCNADDDLLHHADLWVHGHLHCRHDHRVARGARAPTRVVCQARGLAAKGEPEGFEPLRLFQIPLGRAGREPGTAPAGG